MAELEVAPLRSLNDFLLSGARFSMPDMKDPVRVNNRMVNNLLYYQTNYFLMALIIFVIIGVMHPAAMLLGCATFAAAFGAFTFFSNQQSELKRFKQQHPLLGLSVVLVLCYFLMYLMGSILVFLFGIAVPLLACLIHAALRIRNWKNKVTNRIEHVGLKRTPMGVILEALGQENEAGS